LKGDLDYSRAALVVWDMQYGIAPSAQSYDAVVGNIKLLLQAAHGAGLPVIYSQHTGLPFEFQSEASVHSLKRRGVDPRTPRMEVGTHDWEIVEDLRPEEGDTVIAKHTSDFFTATPLRYLLQNRFVSTVILAGVATEIGIESTARSGAALGFIPIVAEDAVGGRKKEVHEAALLVMGQMFDVIPTEQIVSEIKKLQFRTKEP
jgi:nicotinamidase-related amidase